MTTPSLRHFRSVLSAAAVLCVGCADRPPTVTGSAASIGSLSITDAVSWGLASAGSSSIGFRVTCPGGDTLAAVDSPDGSAMLHRTETGGRMADLETVACDPATGATFGPGLDHIMITDATHGFARGDSVTVTIRWQRAGEVTLRVPIVRYSDAVQLLGR